MITTIVDTTEWKKEINNLLFAKKQVLEDPHFRGFISATTDFIEEFLTDENGLDYFLKDNGIKLYKFIYKVILNNFFPYRGNIDEILWVLLNNYNNSRLNYRIVRTILKSLMGNPSNKSKLSETEFRLIDNLTQKINEYLIFNKEIYIREDYFLANFVGQRKQQAKNLLRRVYQDYGFSVRKTIDRFGKEHYYYFFRSEIKNVLESFNLLDTRGEITSQTLLLIRLAHLSYYRNQNSDKSVTFIIFLCGFLALNLFVGLLNYDDNEGVQYFPEELLDNSLKPIIISLASLIAMCIGGVSWYDIIRKQQEKFLDQINSLVQGVIYDIQRGSIILIENNIITKIRNNRVRLMGS